MLLAVTIRGQTQSVPSLCPVLSNPQCFLNINKYQHYQCEYRIKNKTVGQVSGNGKSNLEEDYMLRLTGSHTAIKLTSN